MPRYRVILSTDPADFREFTESDDQTAADYANRLAGQGRVVSLYEVKRPVVVSLRPVAVPR